MQKTSSNLVNENTIVARQNLEHPLLMQAAARHDYNIADNLDIFSWIGTIIISVLGTILFNNTIFNFIQILWFLSSFWINKRITALTLEGALFKDTFDNFVYGWIDAVPSKEIKNAEISLIHNSDWFGEQSSKSGDNYGVKDWYEHVNNLSQEDAIKSAISDNVFVDKKVNNHMMILIVILIVILATIFFFNNPNVDTLLKNLFITFASITKKFIDTMINLSNTNKLNNDINLLEENSPKNDDFKSIQKLITIKRQIPNVSNRLIYTVLKHCDSFKLLHIK